MQIVVNPELEGLIVEQVQSGRYETAEALIEEAVRLLVDRDRAESRLETLLVEAEDSGVSIEMDDQKWVEIEQAGLARLREQR